MPLSTRSVVLVGSSLIASVSNAQVTTTFSNVLADGSIGRPENTVVQYTFTQDFQWSGHIAIDGLLLPTGGRTLVPRTPMLGLESPLWGSASSAHGINTPTPGVLMDSSGGPYLSYTARNYRPPMFGFRNIPRNMNGETITIRLGQNFDDGTPNNASLWQSLSLTFLPYTPPPPPITQPGTRVTNAGTFNVLGDTIRIGARTVQRFDGTFSPPAVLAIYNPLGELVTRWQSTRDGATIEVPRTMNGEYFLAYGSTSSEWGDRFYHEDDELLDQPEAAISINNQPYFYGGSSGSSIEEWTKFTVVPAPSSAALFAALPLLARRRRAKSPRTLSSVPHSPFAAPPRP
jgi:hypothetical protein